MLARTEAPALGDRSWFSSPPGPCPRMALASGFATAGPAASRTRPARDAQRWRPALGRRPKLSHSAATIGGVVLEMTSAVTAAEAPATPPRAIPQVAPLRG